MSMTLTVWWDGARVGALSLDDHGDIGFVYDADWLADPGRPPISVSLPKQADRFSRGQTRPFFAGLLPEEAQRDGAAHALGVSAQNDFGLLEALGGDVAGALSLWPEGEAPPTPKGLQASEPLSDAELLDVFDRLPRRPFLAGEGDIRVSLAGAQQKMPVVLVNGHIAIPAEGQPSTHILKPAMTRLPGTTQNEAFAMRLAAALALPVAPVEPRRTGDRTYLLVARYDREVDPSGSIRRLHQEDFCQALGISPEHKYASEGGPTFRDCFALVRQACAVPAPSVLRLLDAAIFNVLVGNADAHGKNYSLLYRADGIDLAPLYDLMCTAAYPEVHANLAMKVAKRARLEDFTADTWREFGREVGIGPRFVHSRAVALAGSAQVQIPAVVEALNAEGFGGDHLEHFADVVAKRAAIVAAL